MTGTSAEPQVFSLTTPYLSEGRSDRKVAATDRLTVRMKVYAEGGENALHAHRSEDHAFIVLEGEATFYDRGDTPTVVGPNEGIMLPRGTLYRFRSSGECNLVILRVGTGKPVTGNDRVGPEGVALPGSSPENKGQPPVPVPGSYFGAPES